MTFDNDVHVSLADNIIPKLRPVFKDREHTHLVLTSGRAGTKSSFAAIRIALSSITEDNCSVVIVRKFHNKLKKTVYKEVLRAIARIKLPKDDFKITVSPMEIRYRPNGNTIYFTGNDSIDDTKGMIDESRPIKYVVIDELTEFFDKGDGEDELLNIEATFSRGNDDVFQILYLFNPPKNPNAPVMAWLEKMKIRPDVLCAHTDYRDVPEMWLGKKLLESAEQLRISDIKLFNWLWLGLCIGIDELIYYMFDKSKHVSIPPRDERNNPISPDTVGIGIDYGQMNATTFQAFGLWTSLKRVGGLGEYYHSGRSTGHQRSPSDYAKDFVGFVERIEATYDCIVRYAYIDPSAKGLAEEIKRAIPRIIIRDAQNSVALGISRVQKCLTFGVLSFWEQPELVKELGLYSYDKKSIERGTEQPIKENDHCQDATRYLIMGMWKQIRRFLPYDDKEE
jgi:PBSX family phage terminase large subunit